MGLVFLLLVVFQIKHYIADYPLQTAYMLQKFKGGREWILPLAAHAGVHALGTFYICMLVTSSAGFPLAMAFIDFCVHFVVDRVKASPRLLGKYKVLSSSEFANATEEQKKSNRLFWLSLGADQTAHHLTHYFIIACVYYHMGG